VALTSSDHHGLQLSHSTYSTSVYMASSTCSRTLISLLIQAQDFWRFSHLLRWKCVFFLSYFRSKNLTPPTCSSTPISCKMRKFLTFGNKQLAKLGLHIFFIAHAQCSHISTSCQNIWYHRVPRPRYTIRCSNLGDSAITKGQIAYFSLRMRETPIGLFLLPVKNLTSPACSQTPISYIMKELWRFRLK